MTRQQRRQQLRALERLQPTIDPAFLFSWDSQFCQYPGTGPPGIAYFRGDIEPGVWVDCLLYRDPAGRLIGILNHYPMRIEFGPLSENVEEPGNVNTWVHPDYQGLGVGRALHRAAWERWAIDYTRQRYTPAGLAFVRRLLASPVGSACEYEPFAETLRCG